MQTTARRLATSALRAATAPQRHASIRRVSVATARSSPSRKIKVAPSPSPNGNHSTTTTTTKNNHTSSSTPHAVALFDRSTSLDPESASSDKLGFWKPQDRARFRTYLLECLHTGLVSAGLRKSLAQYPILTTPWTDHELVLLVGALIKSNRTEQALQLLQTQIKDLSDKNRLNRVAAESARLGNAFVALGVLDIARHFRIAPDVVTYTSAIHACARAGRDDIPQAIDIFEEMLADGVTPNHRTFGAVVLALARMNKWDEIEELVDGIRFDDALTKSDVFSSAITACAHNRQFVIASKLYAQLMDDGVYPGEKVSNAALSACARTSDVEQMHKVMAFMEAHGEPSIYTYNTMLSAYSQAGHMDDALTIYQRMQNRGFKPDVITFNALLLGARRSRRCDLLPLILDNMNARGIVWDVYTLNGLLELSAVQGSVENANDFWRTAWKEKKLRYDRTNYETLFGVYYECGEYQAIIDFWSKDRWCRRRAKSAKTLNFLLRACSKLGQVETANALLDEFVGRGQEPTAIAHNHILSTYLAADDWPGAQTQLEVMANEPALATTFAFTSVMKYAFKKSHYADALSVFEHYLDTCEKHRTHRSPLLQYPPDALFILAGYAADALGDHEQLVSVYQVLPLTTLSTAVVTEVARLVLASCEKRDDWRCAVALYGELSKHLDDDTNVQFYEVVVKVVARAGAFERALELNGGEWYRDNRHDKGWF